MEAFLGTIMPWPGTYAPRGWMMCSGTQLQISQYNALYAVLGVTYGGDGRTTFNLPDLRGRTIVGAGQRPDSSSYFRFGTYIGFESNAVQLPAHTHLIPTNMPINMDLANVKVNVSSTEMTVTSTGTYGVPVCTDSAAATGVPSTSDYYIGPTKLANGSALNMYYKSEAAPGVTTKPTPITVVGKATPNVSASLTGSASLKIPDNTIVSPSGVDAPRVSAIQPCAVMYYIICIDGYFPARND